jgi:hypothetical protein
MELMRRLALFSTVFALIIASLMDPYQHVHLRLPGPHSFAAQDDDDDSAIVHIHFVVVSFPSVQHVPENLATPGDDHVARALDILTCLVHAGFRLSVLPVSDPCLYPLLQSQEQVAEPAEACGHDPPILNASIPRAPPA